MEPSSPIPFEILDEPSLGQEFGSANEIMDYRSFGSLLEVSAAYRLDRPHHPGNWLTLRGGPQYMAGWPLSVAGDLPFWRELRQSFLFTPQGKEAIWISVQDSSDRAHWSQDVGDSDAKMLVIGRVGASLEALDAFLGRPVERAVFVVDNALTAPVSETLALQLERRGGRVEGYITGMSAFEEQIWSQFRKPPMRDPFPGFAWFLLLVSAALALIVERFASRRVRRRLLKRAEWDGGGAAVAWRLVAALVPILLAWWVVAKAVHLPEVSTGFMGLFLLDAARVGLAPLSLLALAANLLTFFSLLKHRPNTPRKALLLLYWAPATLLFAVLVMFPIATGLSVFEALILLSCAGASGLWSLARKLWLGIKSQSGDSRTSRTARKGRTRRTVLKIEPLDRLRSLDAAGQKPRWLGIASTSFSSTLPGLVVFTTIRDFGDGSAHHNPIDSALRVLGPGPFLLRSSAPDEDLAEPGLSGLLSAGRYLSLPKVPKSEVPRAISKVLASYLREGVASEVEVAVLIQEQLKPKWAGVALREPEALGGGILVEGAEDDSAAVTLGAKGVLWSRIGRFSQEWVGSGSFAQTSGLSPKHWVDLFAVLEARFKQPVMVEWGMAGGQLVLFQVKPAPAALPSAAFAGAELEDLASIPDSKQSPKQGLPTISGPAVHLLAAHETKNGSKEPLPPFSPDSPTDSLSGSPAQLLHSLAPALFLRRYPGSHTILTRQELAELSPTGDAKSLDFLLISKIFEESSQALSLGGWPHRKVAKSGPTPQVLCLNGRLYLNRVPQQLVAHSLLGTLAFWQRLMWRLSPGGALKRLETSIQQAQALLLAQAESRLLPDRESPPSANTKTSTSAGKADAELLADLELFTLAVGRVARDFFDAGLLASALGASTSVDLRWDPLLSAVVEGQDNSELARRFPYRSFHEWSLEQGRLGESLAGLEKGPELAPDGGSESEALVNSAETSSKESQNSQDSKEALFRIRAQMRDAFSQRDQHFSPILDTGSTPSESANPKSVLNSKERVKRALALARDNLSFAVALLRLELLDSGALDSGTLDSGTLNSGTLNSGTLNSGTLDSKALESGALESGALAVDEEGRGSPHSENHQIPRDQVSLSELEAWAAGDLLSESDGEPRPGLWGSGTGPITARIVALKIAGEQLRVPESRSPELKNPAPESTERALHVFDLLTLDDVLGVPSGAVVLVLGGNRLSHPAEVLRARNIPALFGAEDFIDILQSASRVELRADGVVVALEDDEAEEGLKRAAE